MSDLGGAEMPSSVPLALPESRGGLPVPLQVVHTGRSMGAAGAGWDIPFSYLRVDDTFAHRLPQFAPGAEPSARQRIELSLLGSTSDLFPTGGGIYAPRVGTLALQARRNTNNPGIWEVSDGSGLLYTFEQHPQYTGRGLWLLTRINGSGSTVVTLRYDVNWYPIKGGQGAQIDLVRIELNSHPTQGCHHDEIVLSYGPAATAPYSLGLLGQTPRVRMRTLAAIEVQARAVCIPEFQSLRRYDFNYLAGGDPDTGLPRLQKVTMAGRPKSDGTRDVVPVSEYAYGQLNNAGKIDFVSAGAINLPAGPDKTFIASSVSEGTVNMPVTGTPLYEKYAQWQGLTDLDGDGRPDLVFKKNGKLWFGSNTAGPGGTTVIGQQTINGFGLGPLTDTTFTSGSLEMHTSKKRRFNYPMATANIVDVWRQEIDINGDGRIDLIDASEESDTWVVYLNRPGGTYGFTWEKRRIDTSGLKRQLVALGHRIDGSLPLSRRSTGADHHVRGCWRANATTMTWKWAGDLGSDCGDVVLVDQNGNPFPKEAEKTFVDWQLNDLNGDGYPDFLASTSSVDFRLTPPQWFAGDFTGKTMVKPWPKQFSLPLDATGNNIVNIVRGYLNFRGAQIGATAVDPFASFLDVATGPLEQWVGGPIGSPPENLSTQLFGFADVNGDGLLDRVESTNPTRAYLGHGSGYSGVYVELPGPLTVQRSEFDPRCTTPTALDFESTQTGLRDLTGDGIPDYVTAQEEYFPQEQGSWGRAIVVGTGSGFVKRFRIGFPASTSTETCDGNSSKTIAGLFDIDGDGKPELISARGTSFAVSRIKSNRTERGLEAGQLVEVRNGHGAVTTISWGSAKDDTTTWHAIPSPEIVVASTSTASASGAVLVAGSRFAYGNAAQVFDPYLKKWVFPGYGRTVELKLFMPPGGEQTGQATVVDSWELSNDFQTGLSRQQRWLRYLRVGHTRNVFSLSGYLGADPWALLRVDQSSASVNGVTHHEWQAKHFMDGAPSQVSDDCFDMVDPYDFDSSQNDVGSNQLNTCFAHGFTYGASTERWRGVAAPPSTSNVRTRGSTVSIDDFGRMLLARHDNDVNRSDDDLCVETAYASPTSSFQRMLGAVATRNVTDCSGRRTYSSERFEYDGLPTGYVDQGFATSRTFDRRRMDTGTTIGTAIRSYDAVYDAFGALTSMTTQRGSAVRTATFGHDLFGLVTTWARVDASGVPSTTSSAAFDPVTLEVLGRTDALGKIETATYDLLGRPTSRSVTAPGFTGGVVETLGYYGFEGGDPNGRRVVSTRYIDPTPAAQLGLAPRVTSTSFIDELGRSRRTRTELGADYAGEEVVSGDRTYDDQGRVRFAADPYLLSEEPGRAYGTTYHYRPDGDLECAVRGSGDQPRTFATDLASEVLPTCFDLQYSNGTEVREVRDAASLTAGIAETGVFRRTIRTAIGRVLSTSTWKGAARLEHAELTTDAFGQMTSFARFQNPAVPSVPVYWQWRHDSVGQTLELFEPLTPTRYHAYSDWGEQTQTQWQDGSVVRTLSSEFDALGRTVRSFESSNGTVDAMTVATFAYDTAGTPNGVVTQSRQLGRLSKAAGPRDTTTYGYDALGRVESAAHFGTNGEVYVESMTYRGDGLPTRVRLQLPDTGHQNEDTTYAYDSFGRVRAVDHNGPDGRATLFTANLVDARGHVLDASYGSTQQSSSFASTGRRLLQETLIGSSSMSRRIVFDSVDALGREVVRQEFTNGSSVGKYTTSEYDALGRLWRSTGSSNHVVTSRWEYGYDPLGNLVNANDLIGALDATTSYVPGDLDRLCRIGYGNGGLGGTACNVTHDAVGNVTSMQTRTGSRQLTYFLSGQTRTVTQGSAQATYTYDAFGGVQELDLTSPVSTQRRTDRRFGSLVERRDVVGGSSSSSQLIRRITMPDGSTLATKRGRDWVFEKGEQRGGRYSIDMAGSLVQETSYQPFGEVTSTGAAPGSALYSSYQWNGGDTLEAFGISQLGARMYDPVIGRFLSRDPLIIPRSAARTNPYAFAMNDPVSLADPTGLDCTAERPCPDPIIWPGGGGGSSDSNGQHRPIITPKPKSNPSQGPQTEGGRRLKWLARLIFDDVFGSGEFFDNLAAQKTTTLEEKIQTMRNAGFGQAEANRAERIGNFVGGFGDRAVNFVVRETKAAYRATFGYLPRKLISMAGIDFTVTGSDLRRWAGVSDAVDERTGAYAAGDMVGEAAEVVLTVYELARIGQSIAKSGTVKASDGKREGVGSDDPSLDPNKGHPYRERGVPTPPPAPRPRPQRPQDPLTPPPDQVRPAPTPEPAPTPDDGVTWTVPK